MAGEVWMMEVLWNQRKTGCDGMDFLTGFAREMLLTWNRGIGLKMR